MKIVKDDEIDRDTFLEELKSFGKKWESEFKGLITNPSNTSLEDIKLRMLEDLKSKTPMISDTVRDECLKRTEKLFKDKMK